ncbi:MAG: ATP-binding protein [Candidatus Omnitrophota bacterium]|nr:HAMP domain-containing protein [Candidatus Omnitrophota bacterium]
MGNIRKYSITVKLILWFLFIALVPIFIATYISYASSRKVLEEEVTNSLIAIADNKANLIEAFLAGKEEDIARLSYMGDLVTAMEEIKDAFKVSGPDSDAYLEIEKKYKPFLAYYQRAYKYDDIILISPQGEVMFSLEEWPGSRSLYEVVLYEKSELAEVFIKVQGSLQSGTSDFEYYPKTKEAAAFIAEPVMKDAELIGVVVARMSNKGLYRFVQDYSGLGSTGETILVTERDEDIVFVTPLRFDADAAFTRTVEKGSEGSKAVQWAVDKSKGSGISTDYRGTEVLAIWLKLSLFDLGMVVKMDTKEVFSSAEKLRKLLSAISMVLLLIVSIMAVMIAGSISKPIKELTKTSRIITSGDLSARARAYTNDEVGELAQAFNQMTDSLVEAKDKVEEERVKIEEQAELLKKANQELDSFVYTVSHDLRAPLRGIGAFASFLEEDFGKDMAEDARDHVKEITKGVNRLNAFIDDLLTLSRISRIKNPYENVDINELIKESIERIKFDIQKNEVNLKVQGGLPTMYCDRIKMNEVFLNLINNAIKFSSKNKTSKPRVEIGFRDEGQNYIFFVKDNGIGIDPKDHDKVFGMFKRIQTAEEFEGTGAGLSIVKKIIEDHHGKIWIDSEMGKGAAFLFSVPKDLKGRRDV